jgi:LTXXQ motif family protein
MQLVIKIALLAAGLATVPSAAAILSSVPFASSRASKSQQINMSFQEPRVIAVAGEDVSTKSDSPIELAQATDRPWAGLGAGTPGRFPGQFGPPPVPRPPGPFGFAPPAGPPPSPRVACEEDVDRLMGFTGYLKSKMRLQGEQKSAWQKVEQAAAPGVEKIRDLCRHLPSQPAPPPNLLEHIDFTEMQMTARLELLRAVHEPFQALYETLSLDQRALLIIDPRLFHSMPLPPAEHRL